MIFNRVFLSNYYYNMQKKFTFIVKYTYEHKKIILQSMI